jgi:cytochrome c oxidase subunit II
MMTRLRRLSWIAIPALLLITSCAANAPQDTLKPDAPVARRIDHLFKPVFWIAAGIFFLVEFLILLVAVKFRDRPGRAEPKQIHGNARMEFAWTLVPALILLGVAVPTVVTIFGLTAKATPQDVRVKVIGHQWWWEYRYLGTKPEIISANELVIPTGRQVILELESVDVIHSFWVPKLAGKQDVVPERTNTLELVADKPGEYYGQCAEFCSISHANMRLRVIAKTSDDYARWIAYQQRPANLELTGEAAAGRDIFMSNACISCHAITGMKDASATTGPNLTHLMSRGTFASAIFETEDQQSLFDWVKHARDQKPGVLMPNFDRPLTADDPSGVQGSFKQLSDDQIAAVVAFLRSLT